MGRLIDEDKVLNTLSEVIRRNRDKSVLTALMQVGDAIIDCPTVDAVEVVRCKDCEYITPVEGGLPLCTLHDIACAYNDFCSHGERRSDE